MCIGKRTTLRTRDTSKITANDLEGTPDKLAIIFKPNLKRPLPQPVLEFTPLFHHKENYTSTRPTPACSMS